MISRMAFACAALTALAGCGSSSDAPDPIALTFSPASLAASFPQGGPLGNIALQVTLSRVPDSQPYVRVEVDADVLASGSIQVTQTDADTFSTTITPRCTLAPGHYAGNLRVRFCTDPACQGELPLAGNVLPYAFEVRAGQIVTAVVDGVAVPGFFSACTSPTITAKAGRTVQLTSSVPVKWLHSIYYSAGSPVVQGLVTSETTWTATIADASGGHVPGVTYGFVDVAATPPGGRSLSVLVGVKGW